MNQSETLDVIVELAQEMSVSDPIEFYGTGVQEHTTLRMIATTVLERVLEVTDRDQREITLMAIATHLVTENFALNKRILDKT